jgi:PIN domain nuclease of toxin-antitoxin system
VVVLDTHVWVWWAHGDSRLPSALRAYLDAQQAAIGVSAISCWEVAKLVELQRLALSRAVGEWLDLALAYPGVQLLALTPRIAVESTQLPGTFHRDPADQIIVATARVFGCPLFTLDSKILSYPHVQALSSAPSAA